MPKLKTHSGIKKRVSVTKGGKLMRRRATSNHFLQKKTASRKRHFAGVEEISGGQAKTIRKKMGL